MVSGFSNAVLLLSVDDLNASFLFGQALVQKRANEFIPLVLCSMKIDYFNCSKKLIHRALLRCFSSRFFTPAVVIECGRRCKNYCCGRWKLRTGIKEENATEELQRLIRLEEILKRLVEALESGYFIFEWLTSDGQMWPMKQVSWHGFINNTLCHSAENFHIAVNYSRPLFLQRTFSAPARMDFFFSVKTKSNNAKSGSLYCW
jgi:hypothetical protein